jgi:hypothetical protein
MASQPTRDSARVLTGAGVATAALLLAAAAAVPAFADEHGQSDAPHGNHYGQSKDHSSSADSASKAHTNNGKSGSPDAATNDSTGSDEDPAGNNGTVKIHDDYGDLAHHNVPHVDCDFAVAFWGFDANQTLDVSFAGQAPTGKDIPLTVTGAPTSITSPDAAGGGQDYDNELQFSADQLNLDSLDAPHPQQGYHIKLTVNTYEPGGHKYKVFWLQPCAAPAENGTVVAPASESADTDEDSVVGQTSATGETSSAGESSGGALAPAATSAGNGVPTTVLGRHLTRGSQPAAGAAPSAASLPFTGLELGGLAAAAALALGGGAALTVAGRRRRQAGRVTAS